jgi:hypothetical protein
MFCSVVVGAIKLVVRKKEKEMPDRIKKREGGKEGVKGGIKGREKERQEERNIDYRKLGKDFTLVSVSNTLIFKELMN